LFTNLEKSLLIADWEGSTISQLTDDSSFEREVKEGSWLDGADIMSELVYGKGWIRQSTEFLRGHIYCSYCQHEAYADNCTEGYVRFDWCPYCGADMRD